MGMSCLIRLSFLPAGYWSCPVSLTEDRRCVCGREGVCVCVAKAPCKASYSYFWLVLGSWECRMTFFSLASEDSHTSLTPTPGTKTQCLPDELHCFWIHGVRRFGFHWALLHCISTLNEWQGRFGVVQGLSKFLYLINRINTAYSF